MAQEDLLFRKKNYMLMLLGIALIVIGFILMSGSNNSDPSVFNSEAVYSFRRLTLAPLVILTGFAIEFVAIFSKHKD